MEAKLRHLEFIQDTINRMAKNSFLLKSWAITIVGGLLALTFKEFDGLYIFTSAMVLIFFWLLDGYYLYQEKLFIKLYDHVRVLPEDKIDLSMSTEPFKEKVCHYNCVFSSTMKMFYGGLLAIHVIIILII